MAAHNKLLGNFELVGIPPAPRGVPQVEVKFDIDANGILHVSAKDLGTNKEQSIRITASSGLSEDEINRMVKEAESHAEEDRKKKELIEAKNEADSLIHTVEKTLSEHGSTLPESDRKAIEDALEDCKNKKDNSGSPEEIKTALAALSAASHKVAEHMYKDSQTAEGAAGCSGGSCGGAQETADSDDTIEAEFEEEGAGKGA
jgi:molecular chaperone DnaK